MSTALPSSSSLALGEAINQKCEGCWATGAVHTVLDTPVWHFPYCSLAMGCHPADRDSAEWWISAPALPCLQ